RTPPIQPSGQRYTTRLQPPARPVHHSLQPPPTTTCVNHQVRSRAALDLCFGVNPLPASLATASILILWSTHFTGYICYIQRCWINIKSVVSKSQRQTWAEAVLRLDNGGSLRHFPLLLGFDPDVGEYMSSDNGSCLSYLIST
ncbi:hypothetical protein M8C21_016826, partial [Ambrosia artemisiifolia]